MLLKFPEGSLFWRCCLPPLYLLIELLLQDAPRPTLRLTPALDKFHKYEVASTRYFKAYKKEKAIFTVLYSYWCCLRRKKNLLYLYREVTFMYCRASNRWKEEEFILPDIDIPVFLDSSGRNLDERKTLESWEPFLCFTSLSLFFPLAWQLCSIPESLVKTRISAYTSMFLPRLSSLECHAEFVIKELFDFWSCFLFFFLL